MATIREWYDIIIAEKESFSSLDDLVPNPDTSQTFLDDLTSSSKVAIWRLWAWIMAYLAFLLEGSWAATAIQLEAIVKPAHTTAWYLEKSLEFQYGDLLVFSDDEFKYLVIDESKQVVKKAIIRNKIPAISTEATLVEFILAGEDGGGVVEPLTADQVSAFSVYMDGVKAAGTKTEISSVSIGNYIVQATIYFDPEVLNPDGSLIEDGVTFPVDDKIDEYLDLISFGGELKNSLIVDFIQEAEGVDDIVLVQELYDPTDVGSFSAVVRVQEVDEHYIYNKGGGGALLTYTSI